MTKRQAAYKISQDNYQGEEKQTNKQSQKDNNTKRTFYKIKRDQPQPNNEQKPKINLKIQGLIGNNQDKVDNNSNQNNKQTKTQLFKSNSGLSNQLFKNNLNSQKQQTNPFLSFLNSTSNPFNKPPNTSFFSSSTSSNNFFTSNTSFISGSSSLFNKTPSSFNGNLSSSSSGMNAIFNQNKSLFNKDKQEEQGNQQDSAQLQKQQNIQINPNQSKFKYDYEKNSANICELIMKVKLLKFKVDDHDLLENVNFILMKDKQKSQYFFTVNLIQTNQKVFSGIIVPRKTKYVKINNKIQNLKIATISCDQLTKKPKIVNIKIQLDKQTCKPQQFCESLDSIINSSQQEKK